MFQVFVGSVHFTCWAQREKCLCRGEHRKRCSLPLHWHPEHLWLFSLLGWCSEGAAACPRLQERLQSSPGSWADWGTWGEVCAHPSASHHRGTSALTTAPTFLTSKSQTGTRLVSAKLPDPSCFLTAPTCSVGNPQCSEQRKSGSYCQTCSAWKLFGSRPFTHTTVWNLWWKHKVNVLRKLLLILPKQMQTSYISKCKIKQHSGSVTIWNTPSNIFNHFTYRWIKDFSPLKVFLEIDLMLLFSMNL